MITIVEIIMFMGIYVTDNHKMSVKYGGGEVGLENLEIDIMLSCNNDTQVLQSLIMFHIWFSINL